MPDETIESGAPVIDERRIEQKLETNLFNPGYPTGSRLVDIPNRGEIDD